MNYRSELVDNNNKLFEINIGTSELSKQISKSIQNILSIQEKEFLSQIKDLEEDIDDIQKAFELLKNKSNACDTELKSCKTASATATNQSQLTILSQENAALKTQLQTANLSLNNCNTEKSTFKDKLDAINTNLTTLNDKIEKSKIFRITGTIGVGYNVVYHIDAIPDFKNKVFNLKVISAVVPGYDSSAVRNLVPNNVLFGQELKFDIWCTCAPSYRKTITVNIMENYLTYLGNILFT